MNALADPWIRSHRLPRYLNVRILVLLWGVVVLPAVVRAASPSFLLRPESFVRYVTAFNATDEETITNAIPNAASWSWMATNIPFFECPDQEVEELYYYRWWSFRKHLVRAPTGYVITEFLPPVSHAGAFNTISCAAGFHLMEGRWLRDSRYIEDYIRFWLRGQNGKPQPHFHKYSSWFAAAVWDCYLVDGNKEFVVSLLSDLVADYRTWEKERQSTNGVFWQYDVSDGMEESISGSRTAKHLRPTINSYMYGNARAIASIARLAGQADFAEEFNRKATALRELIHKTLWDADARFFKVRLESGELSDAREAIGFIPWMFDVPVFLAPNQYGHYRSFDHFNQPAGFSAPYGITTVERAHPSFRSRGVGSCEWDGAVWPFATCQTLYGLANYLDQASSDPGNFVPFPASRRFPVIRKGVAAGSDIPVCGGDYFSAFLTYVKSQHADGKPYIGEYLDEVTGDWINRKNRSAFYNHSTFADLLITGVLGVRPQPDDALVISPLLPPGSWGWFCLDGLSYHGCLLTICWDQDGSRYGRGGGLAVYADGREVGRLKGLGRLVLKL